MCGRQIVLKDIDLHGAGVQRESLVHLCIVGTEIYNAEVVFQHMIDVFPLFSYLAKIGAIITYVSYR